ELLDDPLVDVIEEWWLGHAKDSGLSGRVWQLIPSLYCFLIMDSALRSSNRRLRYPRRPRSTRHFGACPGLVPLPGRVADDLVGRGHGAAGEVLAPGLVQVPPDRQRDAQRDRAHAEDELAADAPDRDAAILGVRRPELHRAPHARGEQDDPAEQR